MFQSSWFKKWQPATVAEYVFASNDQKNQCLEFIQNGFIPGNMILYGPAGVGKTALAEILIRELIKSQSDLHRIIKRSVKSLDELIDSGWLTKRPVKSKQKIVYLEEFDKLSPEAKGTLKDGLMEKYQEHVSYICTTNFINRIDHALQTRFTFKYNLTSINEEGTYLRLKQILDGEQIKFEEEKLKAFVKINLSIGLRDLINTLHINSINGQINFDKINIQRSEYEEKVVESTLKILETLANTNDINNKKLCLFNPINSAISSHYTELIDIIQYHHNIDYNSVFLRLNDIYPFLPIKVQINEYLSTLDHKKLPYLHYLSFLTKCMEIIIEINL